MTHNPHRCRRAGRRAGLSDGAALGVQKGFEMAHEVGFYRGCAQAWRHLETQRPGFVSAKADKAVSSLEDKLREFPLGDPRVRFCFWRQEKCQ